MKKLILLLLTLLMFSAMSAIEVDLDESIKLARENNKDIQAEEYSVKSAKWGKFDALSNFLPRASFNSTIVRIDDDTYDEATQVMQVPVLSPMGIPTGDFIPFSSSAMGTGFHQTSYTNSITVQQPIFNGGKIILGYQLASLAKQQAEISLENKELDITYTVASTYFGYLKFKDIHILTQKSLASSVSHLEKVEKNFDVGTAKKSDILQWKVKLNNDKTSNFEIENGLEEIVSFWQNLIGSEESIPTKIQLEMYDVEINDLAAMKAVEITNAKQKFLKKVELASPTLNSIDLINKMMKKSYWMAKGNFLPSVNMQFDYQIESDDEFDLSGEDNWNLVAAVSVPLFTSGSNFSKVKQAKYELLKTKKQTEYVRDNYLIAAENVYNKLITNARIVQDNKIALEFAKENHKLINQLFEQGMITNSELLDAEIMLFGSEMNLISSYYDYVLTKFETKKYKGEMEE
ncbi:MAG: TolC family protein [Candidatus Cloacimonetes bacterium]|jgi:outer membrane protein TolC|nr:TolC family protein [Candidatus Cloacimonadota bacterium]